MTQVPVSASTTAANAAINQDPGPELMLECRHLGKIYSQGPEEVMVLEDVNLQVYAGERIAIVGSSGSGKTTLFNVISGVLPATEGDVVFLGNSMAGARASSYAGAGMGRTFQNIRLFPGMTVLENLQIGAGIRSDRDKARRQLVLLQLVVLLT